VLLFPQQNPGENPSSSTEHTHNNTVLLLLILLFVCVRVCACSRRPTGRPKTRWEDDVRKDIQKSKVPN